MRLGYGRHGRWVVIGLLTASCADDVGVASEGEGSSSTGAGESTTSGGTTMVADASTAGSEDGSSGMGGSSSTGEPVTEVRVSGTILDFFGMVPIVDAQISVLDLPGFETVSDAKGAWEVLDVPVDTFDRFLVADTPDYWGAVVPFQTEQMDLEEVELSQVSLDVIDIQIMALQQQDPTVMVLDDTAVFLVALIQNTATGAVVTVDPPPDPTTFYAPDATGSPILGVNEIQWGIYPVAVFFNLPPGPEGTYEITVTHPERECTVEDPQPPTFGRFINLIRVDCPPPS